MNRVLLIFRQILFRIRWAFQKSKGKDEGRSEKGEERKEKGRNSCRQASACLCRTRQMQGNGLQRNRSRRAEWESAAEKKKRTITKNRSSPG